MTQTHHPKIFFKLQNWPVWQRLQCPHWRSLKSRHRRLLRRAPSEYTSPTRTSQKPVRGVEIKGDCKRGNTAWVQTAHRLYNAHCKKCPVYLRISRLPALQILTATNNNNNHNLKNILSRFLFLLLSRCLVVSLFFITLLSKHALKYVKNGRRQLKQCVWF